METETFKDYVRSLTPRQKKNAIRDLQTGSAEDIIEVFDDFKKSDFNDGTEEDNKKETTAERKRKKLEAAKKIANPKFNKSKDIKSTPVKYEFTRSEIDAMSPEEWAKNEPAVDKAMSKGLVAEG
jgi:hypothetical protein